jgi:hypothetical protein
MSELRDLQGYPCIELGLGLDAFSLFGSLTPPSFYFFLFWLFYMQGRSAGYIPTVSETGTEDPNAHIMAVVFATVASSIFFSGFAFFWYLVTFYRPRIVTKLLLAISIVTASGGFIALSNFPVNKSPANHFTATFIGLGSVLAIQLIAWCIVCSSLSILDSVVRFLLFFGQLVALSLCASTNFVVSNRAAITVSALGEYTFLALLPLFFATFMRDLAGVDQFVLAIDK